MKKNLSINLGTNNLVFVQDHRAVTSSLRVAEYFGKPHNDVLKCVRALDCSQLFREGNFSLSSYSRKNGNISKTYPMYYMTRDGFTFLAMGFTGKVAARFKEAYINAFNEMEAALRNDRATEYAKGMLKARVTDFNKRMEASIANGKRRHGSGYGGMGDMIPRLPFYDCMTLEENLRNMLVFVNNAYLDSMYFICKMQEKEKELEDIRRFLLRLRAEMGEKLRYCQ